MRGDWQSEAMEYRKIKCVGLQGSGAHYERTEEGEIAYLALKRIKQARAEA